MASTLRSITSNSTGSNGRVSATSTRNKRGSKNNTSRANNRRKGTLAKPQVSNRVQRRSHSKDNKVRGDSVRENTQKQKRISGQGSTSDKFYTHVRNGKTRLKHIQISRYVDVWVHDDGKTKT